MDIVELFFRPSIEGAPLSLLLRLSAADDVYEAAREACASLAGRNPWDEIVVLGAVGRGEHDPRTIRSLRRLPRRVRLVPALAGEQSPLMAGISACRWPIILTTSPDALLNRAKVEDLVDILELCDLVVGKRDGVSSWWSWPIDKAIRNFFGVPVADPLCPVKAMRKAAVDGIVLQSRGDLADFELVAKLTFMTSLMDECPVESLIPPKLQIRSFVAGSMELLRQMLAPQFWNAADRNWPVRSQLQDPRNLKFPAMPAPGGSRTRDRFGEITRGWRQTRLRPGAVATSRSLKS